MLRPHLGVIDGFTAVTATLMGFSPQEIGYLIHSQRLGMGKIDPSQIRIIGDQMSASVRRSYRPHRDYKRQLAWQISGTPLSAVLDHTLKSL